MSEPSDSMLELAEACERAADKHAQDPSAREFMRTAAELAEAVEAVERIESGNGTPEDRRIAFRAAKALCKVLGANSNEE